MNPKDKKLVIVSNRLPLSFEKQGDEWHAKPSSGGLVTALEPLLKEHGGVWVGSAGTAEDPAITQLLEEATRDHSHRYAPVYLTSEEQLNFYEGFSNEVVWPLFHDLPSLCNFQPRYWDFYVRVNDKFAAAAWQSGSPADLIWIQDYQLMQTARFLRSRNSGARLAFFLHIPFPSPDIFARLPWRQQVLEGLLQHDVIGVQTARDQRNLLACLRAYVRHLHIRKRGPLRIVRHANHETIIGHFPISIDFDFYDHGAREKEVEDRLRELQQHYNGQKVVLGIDRLDYTKGIVGRIHAFAALLQRWPELRGKVSLIQVAVPSRENIAGYQDLKSEIEQTITHVNGELGQPDWTPITYIHRSIPKTEMLALYRLADVALITPVKDGMNLVSKEYCASRIDENGVLVLSEFAGAAVDLAGGALLCNPHDQLGTAEALFTAINMPSEEQKQRMQTLRNQIRTNNISQWLESFLAVID